MKIEAADRNVEEGRSRKSYDQLRDHLQQVSKAGVRITLRRVLGGLRLNSDRISESFSARARNGVDESAGIEASRVSRRKRRYLIIAIPGISRIGLKGILRKAAA